jgi:hypothetical protein
MELYPVRQIERTSNPKKITVLLQIKEAHFTNLFPFKI